MQVYCPQCERKFDADDIKASGVDEVTCFCGARLTLRDGAHLAATIGRYKLVNQIAMGGMGEVWFALMQGSHGFEKEVAVKRLLPRFVSDPGFTEMFLKEARISALMHHPNIAEIYDLVQVDGHYLVAMEYVAGVPVSAMLQAARRMKLAVPWELGVVVVVQLLRALRYAHRLPRQRGYETFIHRDISPENLLVTQDAVLKIVDFGIAKALGEVSNTAPGMLRGKVCYQTPEALRGEAVSEQTDLFPAAIVLYECWTMQSLFRGTSHPETFRKVALTQVPALSQWRQDIGRELEQVMRRALAHAAGDRYPHAGAFEMALLHACAPRTFEDMQATMATFLEQHTELFFAAIKTHKDAPAMLPEDTRKILFSAGRAPNIEHILTDKGAMAEVALSESAAKGRPASLPKWHGAWAALTLAVALGCVTAAIFWRSKSGDVAIQNRPSGILSAMPGTTALWSPAPLVPSPSSSDAGANRAEATPVGPASTWPVSPFAEASPGCASVVAAPSVPVPLPDAADGRLAPGVVELNTFFRRRGGRLVDCFAPMEGALNEDVVIQVDASGTVDADLADGQLGPYRKCFLARLKSLRFRPFDGPSVHYILPLRVAPVAK